MYRSTYKYEYITKKRFYDYMLPLLDKYVARFCPHQPGFVLTSTGQQTRPFNHGCVGGLKLIGLKIILNHDQQPQSKRSMDANHIFSPTM